MEPRTLGPRLYLACAAPMLAASCGTAIFDRSQNNAADINARNEAGLVELQYAAPAEGVILQVFNWPFNRITERMEAFAEQGYTHLHVSPPSLSINRTEWWARYQPLDYRVIDGPLGDEQSFLEMNQKAEEFGIKIIADIVLNHMANADFARYNSRYTDNPEQLYYPNPESREKYGTDILLKPDDFNNTGCISDYNNRQEVVYNRLCLGFPDKGLPDLNLNRPNVLRAQQQFLKKLVNLGVDGFRIDALKHLPPEYISKVLDGTDHQELLVFGEIITDERNIGKNIGPYESTSDISFYDFPLLFLMKRALGPGGDLQEIMDPEAVGAAVTGSRSITFVTNHDIPNNGDIFRFLKFYDRTEEHLAYAFILGRSRGLAYVYTDLGRSDGLSSDEYVDAWSDPVLAKMMQFRRSVQGTNQTFLWESPQTLVWMRGTQAFVVMHKSGDRCFDLSQVTYVGLEDGTYEDSISGKRVTVIDERVLATETEPTDGPDSDEDHTCSIAPRSPGMFLKVSGR
jgi:alpha-amylase